MAKEKKQRTVSQEKKRYLAISWAAFIGEFVAILSPFVAIGIANYDKYFVQYNGTKMSISFFLAMAVMGMAIWGITKKKLESTYVTFIIKWVIFAFIFTMLGEMIKDLAYIMWFGLIGIVVALGLDIVNRKCTEKRAKLIEAEKLVNEEETIDKVRSEREQKKVSEKESENKEKKYDGTSI